MQFGLPAYGPGSGNGADQLRPNRVLAPVNSYLFVQELYESREIEKYQVQSTGIINFNSAHFLEGAQVLVPLDHVHTNFSDFVQPMFDKIQVLGIRNNMLREACDLLMPRLVSGELDVSEAESG